MVLISEQRKSKSKNLSTGNEVIKGVVRVAAVAAWTWRAYYSEKILSSKFEARSPTNELKTCG
jgi:hypothetical protein